MDKTSSKINSFHSKIKSPHTMALHGKSLSSPSSNPLFSTIITLYTLILLYFPTISRGILFSPVFLSTSLLVLSLLRLGATQKTNQHGNYQGKPNSEEFISAQKSKSRIPRDKDHDCKWVSRESDVDPNVEQDTDFDPDPNPKPKPKPGPFYAESFVEWNVGAPLEVIHEEYEDEKEIGVIERYASLSLYYPDTNTGMGTDSSSGGDSPVIGNWDSLENLCFQWEEEDREGLIEIELDGKRSSEAEEDNLIEIDLTPAR